MAAISAARRYRDRALSAALRRGSADLPELLAPLGAKLELTHRCNLRCAFCYTDSPRRTLERPAELSDAEWEMVVDEVLGIGVLEAVVTGGEPLLRRELALSMIERLSDAGVAVKLNTNGWHVDDRVAVRLAGVAGLAVHVSIDGAAEAVHDASRGVPGAWRRAVAAIDRLAAHGVRVVVIHVLLPDGGDQLEPLLWQMWSLGVDAVHITPIDPTGAAAEGDWRAGPVSDVRALVKSGAPPMLTVSTTDPGRRPPEAAFLVRPNGDVVPDAQHPFVFGHALEDGLAVVWDRLRAGVGTATRPPGHVGYLHADLRHDGRPPVARPTGGEAAEIERQLRRGRDKAPSCGQVDLAAADRLVESLALSRRHSLGATRRSAPAAGGEFVRVPRTQGVHRLNATATLVLDAATTGTLDDAVDQLGVAHPTTSREHRVRDVLLAARDLRRRGVMEPVPTPAA
jgi:MoaA/NifB/PqqE/SkfB family radical SAM enzyme